MAILTLRPSATDSNADCVANGATELWECVDESSTDEDTTYVSSPGGGSVTFTIPTSGLTTETINSIKLVARSKTTTTAQVAVYFLVTSDLSTQLSDYAGGAHTASYTNYEITSTINYDTGVAFTVAELDDLKLAIYSVATSLRCTQMYIEVDYTPSAPTTNAILFAGD